MIRIAGERLSATVSPTGAELRSLVDADGRDRLWDGDPAWWAGRAPLLFPVIGCVAGGVVRVDGVAYPMPKHGIARHRGFAVVEAAPSRAVFRLDADAETRVAYPFDFALEIAFAIEVATLTVTASVANRGATPMPASFGFHPAFRRPVDGAPSRIVFEHPEHEPLRRIDRDGLLMTHAFPTPAAGDTLTLDDALFEEDALIFDGLWSRACTLETPDAPALRVEWPGMPLLGVWTKPGAPFVCIEPWQGVADPVGYAGELRDKPGVVEIAPGTTRDFVMRVTAGA